MGREEYQWIIILTLVGLYIAVYLYNRSFFKAASLSILAAVGFTIYTIILGSNSRWFKDQLIDIWVYSPAIIFLISILFWYLFKWQKARIKILLENDHRGELLEAITNAKKMVVVTSYGISNLVLDHNMIQEIEEALKNGVDIYLAYSLGNRSGNPNSYQIELIKQLEEIRKRNCEQTSGKLFLRAHDTLHAKALFCDEKYVILGSANWLTNIKFDWFDASAKLRIKSVVKLFLPFFMNLFKE